MWRCSERASLVLSWVMADDARIAETCGFSGLESYEHSWQHVDSRVQYAYGAQSWWWESGVV